MRTNVVLSWAFAIALVIGVGAAISALPRPLPTSAPAPALARPTPSIAPTGGIDIPLTSVNPALIVPPCAEDAAIVGFGEFHDGYWDRYECVAMTEIARDVDAGKP